MKIQQDLNWKVSLHTTMQLEEEEEFQFTINDTNSLTFKTLKKIKSG